MCGKEYRNCLTCSYRTVHSWTITLVSSALSINHIQFPHTRQCFLKMEVFQNLYPKTGINSKYLSFNNVIVTVYCILMYNIPKTQSAVHLLPCSNTLAVGQCWQCWQCCTVLTVLYSADSADSTVQCCIVLTVLTVLTELTVLTVLTVLYSADSAVQCWQCCTVLTVMTDLTVLTVLYNKEYIQTENIWNKIWNNIKQFAWLEWEMLVRWGFSCAGKFCCVNGSLHRRYVLLCWWVTS
jgi:hypothetical protein